MDTALRELSDQIDQATQRLLDRSRVITEPDLRAPSLLPGWTRARVLAHVALGADAMRNLLIGVRTGQDRSGHATAEAQRLAAEIAAFPPLALAADRRSVLDQWSLSLDEAMRREYGGGLDVMTSGEAQAGARRFVAGEGRHGS